MKSENRTRVEALIRKGVQIENPGSVQVGREVDAERISGQGVVIYAGCKLFGASTLIGSGVSIGYEGPVTVENCQVGPEVELKSGFFKESVFLEKACMGAGSHVREGCIIEEAASTAHNVALKQTILFPHVTLGSLINFCDCLMSGGTDRKNHSEVGSSFIHFNYTPNQDKATPSLLGDVPRGVMLDRHPIFLGGQGGLIGPRRLEFGTVTAAGTIVRKDELRPDRLIFDRGVKAGNIPFEKTGYRSLKHILQNNLVYIGNLTALKQWYRHVRSQFVSENFPPALLAGLNEKVSMGIEERIRRLEEFRQIVPGGRSGAKPDENDSPERIKREKEFYDRWPEIKEALLELQDRGGDPGTREKFLESIQRQIGASGRDYLKVIKSLKKEDKHTGTIWLQGIVDLLTTKAMQILPPHETAANKNLNL